MQTRLNAQWQAHDNGLKKSKKPGKKFGLPFISVAQFCRPLAFVFMTAWRESKRQRSSRKQTRSTIQLARRLASERAKKVEEADHSPGSLFHRDPLATLEQLDGVVGLAADPGERGFAALE